MAGKKQRWARVNRVKGQSDAAWRRGNVEAYREDWMREKIARGDWLPADEFERRNDRPGHKLDAGLGRAAKAAQEKKAAPKKAQKTPGKVLVPRPTTGARLADAGRSGAASTATAFASEVLADGSNVDMVSAAGRAAKAGVSSTLRSGAASLVEEGIEEVARRAAKTAAKTAGKAAGKTIAKSAAREGGKATMKGAAKTVLRGNAASTAAFFAVDQVADTIRLASGRIDGSEYGRRSAENASCAAGSLGGAAAGAAIGSVIPLVGTAAGAVVGGLLGSVGAGSAVRRLFR